MGERVPVRARIINQAHGLRELAPAWWALLDRAAAPQPTQTPLWLMAWWSVFGSSRGRELRTVVVETTRGEVIGIVPLLRRWTVRDRVVPVSTLELIGSGEDRDDEICSEYIGPIVARGHEQTVAEAMGEVLCSGQLGAWDELRLEAMRDDDLVVPLLAGELARRRATVEVKRTLECPVAVLPATWEEYLAGLGAQRRYFVRRTMRDLEVWAGPEGARLRRASDPAELAHAWRLLQDLHAARWAGQGVFQSDRFRRFHEIVIPALLRGEGGTLDLLWLEVRGQPVAALYNIVYRGHVQFYQGGRILDAPRGARPGIAIHLLAIRRAIEMGYRTYDFLGRADVYKQKLAPGPARRLVTLSAVAPTLRARASSDLRSAARRLVRLARGLATDVPSLALRTSGG
jgi:CelD/BcsL family acetyltransferase involved in cellulose biosynthesis